MITIHIDNTSDGHDLTHLYDGVENNIVLINPTKAEVIKVLTEHPNDTLLCGGHGSYSGLFGDDCAYVIDITMADLLVGRECIFVWCHASDFARRIKGLKGFASNMFISNPSEARWFLMKDALNESITHKENIFFSDRVNDLIKRNVPLNEWVDILNTDYHNNLDFSVFNMNGLEYFNGDGSSYRFCMNNKAEEYAFLD